MSLPRVAGDGWMQADDVRRGAGGTRGGRVLVIGGRSGWGWRVETDLNQHQHVLPSPQQSSEDTGVSEPSLWQQSVNHRQPAGFLIRGLMALDYERLPGLQKARLSPPCLLTEINTDVRPCYAYLVTLFYFPAWTISQAGQKVHCVVRRRVQEKTIRNSGCGDG